MFEATFYYPVTEDLREFLVSDGEWGLTETLADLTNFQNDEKRYNYVLWEFSTDEFWIRKSCVVSICVLYIEVMQDEEMSRACCDCSLQFGNIQEKWPIEKFRGDFYGCLAMDFE